MEEKKLTNHKSKIKKKILLLHFSIGLIIYFFNLYTFLNKVVLFTNYGVDIHVHSADHIIYTDAVRLFYQGGNPYDVPRFIYTIYYFFIAPHFLLPIPVSYFLRIMFISYLVAFFHNEYKITENQNLKYYILANIINLINEYNQMNTNVLIGFVLYQYYKNHREKPYYALLMLFSFFKITVMFVFVGILIVECIHDKSFLKKELKYLIVIFGIGISSFIISLRMGILETDVVFMGPTAMIGAQHFIFYSFFVFVLFDREIYADKKLFKIIYKNKKKIWILIFILIASIYSWRIIDALIINPY